MLDLTKTRDEARSYLTLKIEHQRLIQADARAFTTIDPQYLIDHAEWCLRWMDCAPEGARHFVAPLQDKDGRPCGANFSENVGPSKAMREAWIARGLDWIALKTAQAS